MYPRGPFYLKLQNFFCNSHHFLLWFILECAIGNRTAVFRSFKVFFSPLQNVVPGLFELYINIEEAQNVHGIVFTDCQQSKRYSNVLVQIHSSLRMGQDMQA